MATIEIIGALISLLYLRLEYKANIWLWPVGVITPLIYIYIFFTGKFYAIMGINVYYLFACIYGWYSWKRNTGGEPCAGIARLPLRLVGVLSGIFAALFAVIAWILLCFTDSPVPYGDALTAALSIVAMWMLAHKYAEQWLVWIVVNMISAGLYYQQELYPTSVLYAVYAIVSIFGYLKWTKMAEK